MHAIVTAGGEIQPNQPLYEAARGGLKSMIDIAGKPMVQWVLDAMSQSGNIDRVVVVGLPTETDLDCAHPLTLLPDSGDMISNIRAGARELLRQDPTATYAILSTGDIPALRGEIVDWLTCQVKSFDQDIYYTIIERSSMLEMYPEAKFNYLFLKDLQVCGGELHCFRLQAALEEGPLWQRLIDARKSPIRQASILGYDAMLFLMLRQLSLKDAEAMVSKKLNVKGHAVLSPYPELGLDVDKPAQLELMREYLSRRRNGHAANF
jgi:molybdopterin-guanine dinucleotide biosynthesis protein A